MGGKVDALDFRAQEKDIDVLAALELDALILSTRQGLAAP